MRETWDSVTSKVPVLLAERFQLSRLLSIAPDKSHKYRSNCAVFRDGNCIDEMGTGSKTLSESIVAAKNESGTNRGSELDMYSTRQLRGDCTRRPLIYVVVKVAI
jgi:hypothetical protein